MLSFALLCFPLLMIFSACMDLFTMRISNRISIALILGFLPLAVLSGLPLWSIAFDSILMHYACGLFILIFTFALFAWGKIGGGDAKLAAASAVWIGWGSIADYLLIACMLGGALALILLSLRAIMLPPVLMQQDWIVRLHQPKGGLPFGVALGLAGIMVYPQTAIWLVVHAM